MKKEAKIKIEYRNGVLPKNLGETLSNADEGDLGVLVAALMLMDDNGELSVDTLSEAIGTDGGDVAASLKFWRGAGIVKNIRGSAKKSESGAANTVSDVSVKPEVKTAHRGGAVERSSSLDGYSSGELASIMEKRRVSAQFVDEAQRVMGKMFRSYDIGILVGIVDRLGFEEEAVLYILNYAVSKGKTTMRYAETVAISFYDEGITETVAVIEKLERMKRAQEVISQIRSLYGIGNRELTTSEKRMFGNWTEKYTFDIDVIRIAYDITVDTIHNPAPKYTNTILERWHAEGLQTADEVNRYLERQSAEKGKYEVVKSYDTDEFFEAALRRSYENLT